VPKVARGVGEVLLVLIETRIATKPPEGSLLIAHGDRRHRSAASGGRARAGLIATAVRSRINVANATGDLRAAGVEFASAKALTTAEQRCPSKKRRHGARARKEATEDWRMPSNEVQVKDLEVSCCHFFAFAKSSRIATVTISSRSEVEA
jgi:hypothetical protein